MFYIFKFKFVKNCVVGKIVQKKIQLKHGSYFWLQNTIS